MNTGIARKWSTKKKILAALGAVIVILAGIYIYVATEKYAGSKSVKEDYAVNALDLIREFRENETAAKAKYTDKMLLVHGTVSELESPDTASVNVKFVDPETGDYLIFAFQDQYLAESKTIREGDSISVKGNSSGSSFSQILEIYSIPFKRSTLVANHSKSGSEAGNP